MKSIDELTCRLDDGGRLDPLALAGRIKERLARNVGRFVTCSIGFAANRQLAYFVTALHIKICRSKADQNGAGRKIGIPFGRTRWCPVKALETMAGNFGNFARRNLPPS